MFTVQWILDCRPGSIAALLIILTLPVSLSGCIGSGAGATTGHNWFNSARTFVTTDYGRIAVVERGQGPAVVYLHGFPLNSWHWRHQLTELADLRRGIAIDLMGLGHSEIADDQDLGFDAQADMVLATLDAMGVQTFDLVGNDSGGAVAQIIAARTPQRVRSLVLTNADVHTNWPPAALGPMRELARQGRLDELLESHLEDPDIARSGLGRMAYENPDFITPELLHAYTDPLLISPARREAVNRFVSRQDHEVTVRIESALQQFDKPTLVLWGTADPFFAVEWAYWLRDTIPGVYRVVEFDGAMLFFTEERAREVNKLLRAHFLGLDAGLLLSETGH